MRLNIFRNPHIDAQVGYLVDAHQDALRNQTKNYWTEKISQEIMTMISHRINDFYSSNNERSEVMAIGLETILDDIKYHYGVQSQERDMELSVEYWRGYNRGYMDGYGDAEVHADEYGEPCCE